MSNQTVMDIVDMIRKQHMGSGLYVLGSGEAERLIDKYVAESRHAERAKLLHIWQTEGERALSVALRDIA